jgi:hypothetical protein
VHKSLSELFSFLVRAVSSALRTSSGYKREVDGRDGVAAINLTLIPAKPPQAAWQANAKALLLQFSGTTCYDIAA